MSEPNLDREAAVILQTLTEHPDGMSVAELTAFLGLGEDRTLFALRLLQQEGSVAEIGRQIVSGRSEPSPVWTALLTAGTLPPLEDEDAGEEPSP